MSIKKLFQPKVVTRSIVYTTYHAKRKKKEEREHKTAYITRTELPPPEPAMSSIDAESPVPKHNKTKVFIPTDPVQHQESFSYQNYQTYHKTEKSNQNESFSYQNYKNHHHPNNKPVEKPKRTYTNLEKELLSKEALIRQQQHEIDRLIKAANQSKQQPNQAVTNTKDPSKPVTSNQNQVKTSNPPPVSQSKNPPSSSNSGGQNQSKPNSKSQNPTNQTKT